MKKKYVVQRLEGYDGIELMADPVIGRHIYGPGEIIELDDRKHDVAGIMGRGLIIEYKEEPVVISTPAKEA